MSQLKLNLWAFAWTLGMMIFAPPLVVNAAPLPALSLQERGNWIAIGQVNTAGYRSKASCTGTLIAPDLVLTAAHCVETTSGVKKRWHFVAGWDRGSFAAHRTSTQALVHPQYSGATAANKFKYDIALLQLNAPIKPAIISPLRLDQAPDLDPSALAVLGYHRRRPNILNGRFNCTAEPAATPALMLLDCEVIPGNSGGPVLANVAGEWRIIGVISARINSTSSRSLAVPLGDWVMGQWRAAIARQDSDDTSR